jgi:hypothetical protein
MNFHVKPVSLAEVQQKTRERLWAIVISHTIPDFEIVHNIICNLKENRIFCF